MNLEKIEQSVNEAFSNKDKINKSDKKLNKIIKETIDLLDSGKIRVAEKINNEWTVKQWIKKAILLSFRVNKMKASRGPYATWYDKIDGKTQKWNEKKFIQAGFRFVPNGVVRKGAFIAKNVVLMPSFVNIGAYVDEGSMIDTWASVGSCAQVGKNCHISGGAGIGGVLEPMQANPTIIEDNCFVGARAEIAEGVIIQKGSVLSMGVYIGASTRIIDRATGETLYGKVPAYSVVVPGSMPSKNNPDGPSLYCVIIVKKVDEKTRSKTSINDLLRD
jgi:2,3,4,5-tetrahydropyridine-2-carboxylate N-succinyltransferase